MCSELPHRKQCTHLSAFSVRQASHIRGFPTLGQGLTSLALKEPIDFLNDAISACKAATWSPSPFPFGSTFTLSRFSQSLPTRLQVALGLLCFWDARNLAFRSLSVVASMVTSLINSSSTEVDFCNRGRSFTLTTSSLKPVSMQ